MDKIAILPAFGAIYLLYKGWDARTLFVYYFLPILTLIPAYYDTKLVPGIPEFNFWNSALIPIVMHWIFNEKMEGYKFSWIDLIIVLHLIFLFYAQFNATGYKDAQKIIYREILKRFIPYVFMKAILIDEKRRMPALKMITYLGVIIAVFMVYEFRFYHNYLDIYIRRIWPHSVPWNGTLARYGFKRAAGSMAHPISAGFFFTISAPLAFWLWQENQYKNKMYGFVIFMLNSSGIITSISRAPIAGFFLGFVFIWFGWSRTKDISAFYLILAAIVVLSIAIPKIVEYVSIERSMAKNKMQENAAYRKEMLDNYIVEIKKKPFWGWGRYTFPVVNGQKSIDNEYLFFALTAGMMNLVVYIIFGCVVLMKLAVYVIANRGSKPAIRLGWVLIGTWISTLFTQTTVYSGMQTTHYFFMTAAIAIIVVQADNRFLPEKVINKVLNIKGENIGYNFSRTL